MDNWYHRDGSLGQVDKPTTLTIEDRIQLITNYSS
jgi:hypothetical protein